MKKHLLILLAVLSLGVCVAQVKIDPVDIDWPSSASPLLHDASNNSATNLNFVSRTLSIGAGGTFNFDASANFTGSASVFFNLVKQAATTGATGVVQLANSEEAQTASDAAKAVTPAALAYAPLPAYALRQTWSKLYAIGTGSIAQLRLLSFGDSMAGTGIDGKSLARSVFSQLSNIGALGQGISPTIDLTGAVNAGDSTGSSDSAHYTWWPLGITPSITGAGGTITYGSGGAGAHADTLKVYYKKESGAGSFKVQSSSDAGSTWNDESGYTSVSAANGSVSLGIITITKTVGNYMLRVVGISGTVYFLPTGCGQLRDLSESGVEIFSVALGGLALTNANLSSSAVWAAWLADIAPDLCLFEMKESASTLAADVASFQSRCDAGAPAMDVVYVGSSPTSGASGDSDQLAQNAILRAFAVANNKVYFDAYGPMANYATALARGWVVDGTHRSAEGSAFLGSQFLRQCNLLLNAYSTAPWNFVSKNGRVVTRLDLGNNAFTPNVSFLPETTYGLTTTAKVTQFLYITDSTGTLNERSWGFGFTGSYFSFSPAYFRVGYNSGNPYIQADSTTQIAIRASPSGALMDFACREIAAASLYSTGSRLKVTLPNAVSTSIALYTSTTDPASTVDVDYTNGTMTATGATVRLRAQRTGSSGSPTDFEIWTLSGGSLGKAATFTSGKNLAVIGSITTGSPTSGTAAAWKLGSLVTATVAADTTRYLQVDVAGTAYKVIVAQ